MDKKNSKDTETQQETTAMKRSETQNDDENDSYVNKRPKLYERKTKVTGNDSFLKQIFS